MYISTLRSHIETMGGQLEVVAKFADGMVKISNFSELARSLRRRLHRCHFAVYIINCDTNLHPALA